VGHTVNGPRGRALGSARASLGDGGGSMPARGKARVGVFPFSFYSLLSI
jgi:hypothetical protein